MKNLPFGREGRFYRGNLHTHFTRSDGRLSPEAVVDTYRKAGYDFLVLSDHFLARYGWAITDTRHLHADKFTTLIGAELHAPATRLGELWHIKAVGLPLDFEPAIDTETGPDLARRAAATGAFIGIVHPSWYGLTREDAHSIDVAYAVEVYNHGCHIDLDRGTDWPFLDGLLNEGRRLSGYASDDAHFWHEDYFGGWVQVHAQSLDPNELLDSLKAGRYYSSQGPQLYDVRICNEKLKVHCSPANVVAVTGKGAVSEKIHGCGLTECELPIGRFMETWFRLTVIDRLGRRAWTNPIWLD